MAARKPKAEAAPALQVQLPPKAQVLWQEARFKSLRGGRGSAKSHSIATYLLLEGMQKKHRILCAREYQNSIGESVLKLLADKITALGLDHFYEVQQRTIIGKNGTELIFAGLRHNIQSIKSMEGLTLVWCEEAQTISEDSWQILIPTVRAPGSQIILSWNPDSEEDPTFERFVTRKPADCVDVEMNWSDNPFWNSTLEAERLRDKDRLSEEEYEHIWEGKCRKISNARIFGDKVVVEEFETPVTARFYFGLDHGFANDPACLVRMFVKDESLHIDYSAYAVGVELDELLDFCDLVPQSRLWPLYCDAARPETNSHLARHGFRARSAEKWPGSIEDGIAFLRGFKRIVIHPRNVGVLKDFRGYSYKVDRMTKEVLPIPVDRDNHATDAARYGLFKLIRKKGVSIDTWLELAQS